ncbi:hypothetical protein [Alteromonas halophila]|uniref:Uncharacterized protein n=1 Tax=Alteromonas halophila TaxID=516698 RepID=A0A918MUR9_9ALTE|nr:hypothetical protein [Alteromonas halophila]GGW74930.1 hypothetical protein GCM10007391_03870 [Alteromonas halophila]
MTVLNDQSLSMLAMYALTAILLVALIMSAIAAVFAFKYAPESTAASLLTFFSGGTALKILTVFAVLITATYLALANQLTEAAIALLSSVAGYVLGSIRAEPK